MYFPISKPAFRGGVLRLQNTNYFEIMAFICFLYLVKYNIFIIPSEERSLRIREPIEDSERIRINGDMTVKL
jgi:hypothetical protein